MCFRLAFTSDVYREHSLCARVRVYIHFYEHEREQGCRWEGGMERQRCCRSVWDSDRMAVGDRLL